MTVTMTPKAHAAFQRLEAESEFMGWRDEDVDQNVLRMWKTVNEILRGTVRETPDPPWS